MSKNNMIFWLGIIALAIVGTFFYFWVIIPALLGIVLFYSIQFYKSKNYLVYPAIIFGTLLLCFSAGELYRMDKDNAKAKIPGIRDIPSLKYLDAALCDSNKVPDPILGYRMKPVISKTACSRVKGDEVLYDALYTTDEKGRRITPDNQSTADTLIILLGCSFTFGFGLNDHETFSWQLAELLGPKFQVLNYGVNGYGSHQMFALLESDRLDEIKNQYKNVYAYYLTFPSVEKRSAGIPEWAISDAPWYELDKDGSVNYIGKLNDKKIAQYEGFKFSGKFAESLFLKKILSLYQDKQQGSLDLENYMLDLHAGIIKGSAQIFFDKFGDSTFTTVVYPNYNGLKKRLIGSDVSVLDMTDYFGDFSAEKYEIPHDGHPNYEAAKVIAKAYYEDVMKKVKKSAS